MPHRLNHFLRAALRILCVALCTAFFCTGSSFAQKATIKGTVRDSLGRGIENASVGIEGIPGGTFTNEKGYYDIEAEAGKEIKLVFSFIGFRTEKITLVLKEGETRTINRTLTSTAKDLPVTVITDQPVRNQTFIKLDPRQVEAIPTPSGSFEAILRTLPGVIATDELSAQYSVRGGNFDENLVYVNDIEIYRPVLIRSGQQEGLSFINSDLVSGVQFSAGGFDAIYGDKLSSVLDIRYKKPLKFAGSASGSLLGGTFHLEGVNKKKTLGYLFGLRNKSTNYLLKTLDTKGNYKPSFTDVQAYINCNLTKKTELSFLGNYGINKYSIIPETRETEFGTINEALRLTIYFEGQEVDRFRTMMGALSLTHYATEKLRLKLITSTFNTLEEENFDLQGAYFIDELERDLGSSEFGEAVTNRGIGAYIDHARNHLDATVANIEHKGYLDHCRSALLQWGIRYQREMIEDDIREWRYVDSADFSIPHPPDFPGDSNPPEQEIILPELLISENALESHRFSAFIQENFSLDSADRMRINAGVRTSYWSLNEDVIVSPRISYAFTPNRRLTWRLATGIYHQPQFYREMRNLDGTLNTNLKAQESIHFVAGNDFYFLGWGREFKLTTEAYYKILRNMIPYKVDNLRIRYLPGYTSEGYATGADVRINGEFVPGIESWANLSFLKTEEDIDGDFYYEYYNDDGELIIPGYTLNNIVNDSVRKEPGYIPRPTDQRVTFSILFQDYLPKFPSYKMHLTLVYGTGLPFGPPGYDKYKDILRFPDYRRVDIGFSKTFIEEDVPHTHRFKLLNRLRALWISLEVFNLFQVSNTVSYLWVTDVTNRKYAVPNYLTNRQINFRVSLKF